jgi:CelD/BcsL family acetyltransferase involved in cellulose biosynthesis/peptidoglycan/xylan/chitin deacetylase (PgdA/CDA1 family)
MKVLLHESWEDVQTLSDSWNRLLAESASSTIFLTWEWVEAWWKNYGSARPLFVLSAWEGNSLEGLAPFFAERVTRWGSEWTCLKLVGDGSRDSDYLDCIARRGRENEVVAAFVQFLESHPNRWNYLELHGTPEGSPCLAALQNLAREKSWRFSLESIPCATLTLPREWSDYLRSLKPRFRTKVRSTLNHFDENIRATPYSYRDERTLDQGLAVLFDLHTRRWQTKSQPGVFQDGARQNFYRDISHAALRQGWLAFHRLDWGERALAMQYGFIYDNRFFLLQEGYDPEFAALRPGIALRGWLMRYWIESGLKEYDFLAGSAPYKLEWGAQVKQCVRLMLAPSRRSAWVGFGEGQVREKSKEAIRAVIPENVLVWRRELIARRGRRGLVSDPASSLNGHRRSIGQRVVSALYAAAPLQAVGQAVASRFELDPARHQLRRRTTPICHIFIYHRVNDDYDPFLPAVPVAAFRRQMEFLKKHFPVLSLNEIASNSFPKTGEKYCVAITFDDGYRDNFLCAFPVLKALDLPATIFLTTGCIDSGQLPWYDQISWAFKLTTQEHLSLSHLGGPDACLGGHPERLQAISKTLAWLRVIKQEDRLRYIPRVLDALRVPVRLSTPNSMLSWEEVRQMHRHKISFGAHTVSHPVLAKVKIDELEMEIIGSKKRIEEKLQSPVEHFAYPFGQPSDVSTEAKHAVQQGGFSTGVTTVWGFNRPGDDLFELKRFSPRFNPWDFHPGRFALMLDWYRLVGVRKNKEQTLSPVQ